MQTSVLAIRRYSNRTVGGLLAFVFAITAHTVSATTFMSVEPIPSGDVVGQTNLDRIRSIGFENLELWAQRLLDDCDVVDDVIDVLLDNEAITTVTSTNTRFVVGSGGFEGATNPSYVFTIDDSGAGSVSEADVDVLSNAMGYVLNQSGTAHFNPDDHKAYAFALDYAVVTFPDSLSGLEARDFFEHLGTIDPALFSGPLAGFTQINFGNSTTNNSMLFLQPAVPKHRFIIGLAEAVASQPPALYSPTKNNGTPTTARAGIAFPVNDWLGFPDGDQYLANIGSDPQLLSALAALRQKHLTAVASLLQAIAENRVTLYLTQQFSCPN
jgi:hypothetical protein